MGDGDVYRMGRWVGWPAGRWINTDPGGAATRADCCLGSGCSELPSS